MKDSIDPGDLTEKELQDLKLLDRWIDSDSVYEKKHKKTLITEEDISAALASIRASSVILTINKTPEQTTNPQIRIHLAKSRPK